MGLAPYVLPVIFPATEHREQQSQQADFSKFCYSCPSPHLWGKNLFRADRRRGLRSSEILAFLLARCPIQLKHLYSAGLLKGNKLFRLPSAAGYVMTRMYLVRSEPAASSSPDTGFTGRQKISFQGVSEDQAADGSCLQPPQGQRESRSEMTMSPTLPCPPLHQEQLSSPCCSTMGTGKGT